LCLVEAEKLWEAEFVTRSLVEGTVKFGYVLDSRSTFTARCVEYVDTLPEISKLRWHRKAEEALVSFPDRNAPEWRPLREIVLSEQELQRIQTIYPRELRRAVEGRWGFTAMLAEISRPGGAFGPVGASLLHSYSIASHLQHMTFEGVLMPLERDLRSESRRNSIHLAYAARLISDCFHCTFVRVGAILRFLDRPPYSLLEISRRHDPLLKELRHHTIRRATAE
jgi:hypothetical protein